MDRSQQGFCGGLTGTCTACAGPNTMKPRLPSNLPPAENSGAAVVFMPLRWPSSKALAQPCRRTRVISRRSRTGAVMVWAGMARQRPGESGFQEIGRTEANATLPCAEARYRRRGLLHERTQVHHLVGHRRISWSRVGSCNPILNWKSPVTAASPLPRYGAIKQRARSRPWSCQLHHLQGHDRHARLLRLVVLVRIVRPNNPMEAASRSLRFD